MCVQPCAPRSQVSLGNAQLAKFHFGGAEPDEAQLREKARFQVELGSEAERYRPLSTG